jgi:WD40 repeat protein/serine/threonine protein kinase
MHVQDRSNQDFGDYHLLQRLGRGGFGEVYLARPIRSGDDEQVALKVLYAQFTDATALKEFIEEARTFRLTHPHILPLLDFDIGFDNIPYLVTEYAAGGTLRSLHPSGTPLALNVVADYVSSIGSGLQYAHERGIVHRDVKPENMLMRADHTVMIGDFGLSSIAHQTHSMSTLDTSGTPAYMAPEQFQGKPRPESDQYALAVIAYEWLTGIRPFVGTPLEIAMQHIQATPVPLRQHNVVLNDEVEQVVMRALSKDYQERYASITVFAEALEEALQAARANPSYVSDSLAAPTISSVPGSTAPTSYAPPGSTAPTSYAPPIPAPYEPTLLASPAPQPKSKKTTIPLSAPLDAVQPSGQPTAKSGPIEPIEIGMILEGSLPISALSWSPNGGYLAVGSAMRLYIFAMALGKFVHTLNGHEHIIGDLAWSPDSIRVASASHDNTIRIWDTTKGKCLKVCRGHTATVWSVDWSRDGKYLVSSGDDQTIIIWDARTGKHQRILTGYSANARDVAWSPKGLYFASASYDQSILLWDAQSGKSINMYKGHTNNVNALAWSSNGNFFASASSDQTIRIWDANSGQCVKICEGHTGTIDSLVWSPNGQNIASGSDDGSFRIWDANTGQAVFTHNDKSAVKSIAWSSIDLFASSTSELHIWNLAKH